MDWYLWFLAALFALLMYLLNKCMLAWQRRDQEKLRKEMKVRTSKCGTPCEPCVCGAPRQCEEFDLCAGRDKS